MNYERVSVESEGFTLSRIIWRRFRRPMPGLFEATLAENPGLAAMSPILPVGTIFLLRIPDAPREPARADVIRLWD